ncbi:ferredoxin reductase family protein [Acidothermaceae bacterium B102]|nr:ferredoxin reductase family protein [Acidothermaceae bacterium B102]
MADRLALSGPQAGLSIVVVGAILSVVPVLTSTPPGPIHLVPLLAHLSGMLAGYGVAVMVAMMSRAPFLERDIGADRLSRWHALGGRTVVSLGLIHASAAVVGWAQARQLDLAAAALEVLRMPGLVAATAGTLLMVGVAYLSSRVRRRRLGYERWHAVHLSLYLAVALTFTHQLAGPDLAGKPVLQLAWSLLYSYAFGLVLRYRFLAPLQQTWRHRLRVERLVPEADGVVSIVMRGRHLDELAAEPGQFFRWRFLTPRTWTGAHPFSLSAPATDGRLRVTIKALGTGSRRLHALQPGTRVLAEGPYGAMTARRRTRSRVLLIAGGVGITPMRALFEDIDVPGTHLTLLYRASSADDVLFRRELDEVARRRGARLIYLVGRSSEPANQLTAATLRMHVPRLVEHDVYLCASPAMSAAIHEALHEAGLPAGRLHEEQFSF